jgi:hypothetical protein
MGVLALAALAAHDVAAECDKQQGELKGTRC